MTDFTLIMWLILHWSLSTLLQVTLYNFQPITGKSLKPNCPDPISGRFRYDHKNEIKTHTESDAMQPCKLYFGELGIRGWAGTWERKKEVKSKKPQQVRKRSAGVGVGNLLPSPQIRWRPATSGWLSLCAGVEVPARTRSSSKTVRMRARGLQGTWAALLWGHLPMRRACPHTCSLCHTCSPLRHVLSCWSVHYSVHRRFPTGHCGIFFGGQEETQTTMAMSRQNQFVAVFYSTPWLNIAAFVVVWDVVVYR